MTSDTTIADVATKIASVTNRGAVTKTFTPSSSIQTYTIPAGYHNGSGKVTCDKAINGIKLEKKSVSHSAYAEVDGYGLSETVTLSVTFTNTPLYVYIYAVENTHASYSLNIQQPSLSGKTASITVSYSIGNGKTVSIKLYLVAIY